MINDILTAILLGFVEGLTEFLPISSTGHLILLVDYLGFNGPPGRVFEIAIQLGAIMAVCWAYRSRLIGLFFTVLSESASRRFAVAILLAFVPAMILGAAFHGVIKHLLFNPTTVSIALIIGGFVILLIERVRPLATITDVTQVTARQAFALGLCQAVALIPGVSRSGATITGGLILGLDRKTAAEFSFFLAIPTMIAATSFDLYSNRGALTLDGALLIGIGFFCAFISALLTVRIAIGFISRHGFVPFAIYRIVLGTAILLVANQ